ncbi:MAG: TolC family outer membrane protein [Burkholderiaceae bacterium]|nr:TolC family outer membrane protein [Burkholderiaceae bacterium]
MNRKHPARGAVRAAACLLLGIAAGASHAIDLMGSYQKALQVDPTRLAADEAVAAGREKAKQGDAMLRPRINLQASATGLNDRSSSSVPAPLDQIIKSESSGTVSQAALQLSQPLYDQGARADKKQLHQQSALAEIEYRHAQQDLMQRVAEAYFGVLLAQESLRVTQSEKAAVALQRDRAQARFDVGRGRITDLQEAQARYDQTLAKEVSAQSTLASAQAQYLELTGVPAQGLAPLRPFAPTPPMPDDLLAWHDKSAESNTRVLVKQTELAIASAEIGRYRLSGRPTVDLVASYTAKNQSGSLSPAVAPDGSRSAAIGLQFNLPLYSGGALSSKERESLAKQRQAEHDLAGARKDARLKVQDSFLSVKNGVARIAALEQSLRSNQTALEATTLGRDVGTRTELDVLDAQQRVYASQLELAQARNDYLLGRVRLAMAAGELQESDLRALDAYLLR